MPSTYSPDLRIELIANGEQSGTWGSTTNSNLGTIVEDAISGLATVSVISANQALTASNGAADQARCAAVALSTTTTANFNVYVPPVTKLYVVRNTDSTYTATVYCSTVIGNTTAAGAGVAIPPGKSVLLRSDGTNIIEQFNYIAGSLQVNGATTFTGAATFGSTVTLNANPTLNLQAATKQYVDNAVAGSIPTGVIVMWSGSIGTIPSGWQLCDGTNGTPDLRNRFIVGAGNAYSPGNTGGSADAIVVSHTHTATSTDSGHTHADAFFFNSSQQVYTGGFYGATFKVQNATTYPNGATTSASTTSSGTANVTTTVASTGSSGTNANLPPYYALAYIMKL